VNGTAAILRFTLHLANARCFVDQPRVPSHLRTGPYPGNELFPETPGFESHLLGNCSGRPIRIVP
jgi:hypothetical protein